MDRMRWKKSTRSVGNPEQCIELGTTLDKRYVRDSKNQRGPTLNFPPAEFAIFMRSVQPGRAAVPGWPASVIRR
jgi:Domain of unknown function (DUF397)